jgi:hypothetical protein
MIGTTLESNIIKGGKNALYANTVGYRFASVPCNLTIGTNGEEDG